MKTLIICNGRLKKYKKMRTILSSFDRIIAVDGGVRHARKMGIKPDLVIGDFDSVSGNDRLYITKHKINMIKFPSVKDKTDSELAVDYCIENGFRDVTIVGYSGSRLDHSLANLTMFSGKASQLNISLLDHRNTAFFIRGDFSYNSTEKLFVSIIPMTEKIIVEQTKGLHFPVVQRIVPFGSTLCVSNYPSENAFSVKISSGTALIVLAQEKQNESK